MNCFHADRLLESFNAEDVRPFTKQLDDQILLSEIINSAKAAQFSDVSLVSYMVCQEARTRILSNGLRAVRKTALTDSVIQLQEALATTAQSPVSPSNIQLLRQLFFCVCARLLSINHGKRDQDMIAILYLLSMESWVSAREIEDKEMISWSAHLFFEALLTVRHHDPDELDRLLCDEEFSSRIVKSLVPGETSIMSLHLKNFEATLSSCRELKHTWSDKNTIDLANRISTHASSQFSYALLVKMVMENEEDTLKIDSDLFLRTLFPSVPDAEKRRTEEQKEISREDLKLFLITSGVWARLMLSNDYGFSSEQCRMWNHFVNVAHGKSDFTSIMTVRKDAEVLRSQGGCLSSKFLYSIFAILERSHFSSSICFSYASRIQTLIEGGYLHTSDHSNRLFSLERPSEEIFPTVEEEDQMLAHVSRYLAKYSMDMGDFAAAENILRQFHDNEQCKLLASVYQQWLINADEGEKQRIRPLLSELLKKTSPTDSEWNTFEKLCSGNSTTDSSRGSSRSSIALDNLDVSGRKSCGVNTDSHLVYENLLDCSLPPTKIDRHDSVDNSFVTAIASPHRVSGNGSLNDTSNSSNHSLIQEINIHDEMEAEETEFLCELLQVQVDRMKLSTTPPRTPDCSEETNTNPLILKLEAEGQQARSKITFLENELDRVKKEKSSTVHNTNTQNKFMQFRSTCNLDTPIAFESPDTGILSPMEAACPYIMNGPNLFNGYNSPTVMANCTADMFNSRNETESQLFRTFNTGLSLSPMVSSRPVISQQEAGSFLENTMTIFSHKGAHPGHSGLCLGCLDDDMQDKALAVLNKIATDWETKSDNEDEC